MKYLLDTNVCVDYLTGRFPGVVARMRSASPDDLCVSSIVVAELRYGAEKSAHRAENRERLDAFLSEMPVVDFDGKAAAVYGRIRVELERKGRLIGPNDLLIAAHSLSLGVTLATDNVREFRRVRGLRVENWRGDA